LHLCYVVASYTLTVGPHRTDTSTYRRTYNHKSPSLRMGQSAATGTGTAA
jgi:hypothetical protein